MASPKSIKVRDIERASTAMAGAWGLLRCKHPCPVCERYHGSPTMVHIRNMYVSGVPCTFIPNIFDGVNAQWTERDVTDHGFRAGWHHKRSRIGHIVASEDTIAQILLRRLSDSQHVVSGSSAEKSIELLMKLWGLGKETTELRAHVGFSWEQQMTRNRNTPGVVTIDDDSLGVDDGPLELTHEDVPDAPAD
jgi:hypothetical protein